MSEGNAASQFKERNIKQNSCDGGMELIPKNLRCLGTFFNPPPQQIINFKKSCKFIREKN